MVGYACMREECKGCEIFGAGGPRQLYMLVVGSANMPMALPEERRQTLRRGRSTGKNQSRMLCDADHMRLILLRSDM